MSVKFCYAITAVCWCLSVQVQATDADQGENGGVLYRILTGKFCLTLIFPPYGLHIMVSSLTNKQVKEQAPSQLKHYIHFGSVGNPRVQNGCKPQKHFQNIVFYLFLRNGLMVDFVFGLMMVKRMIIFVSLPCFVELFSLYSFVVFMLL